MTPLLAEEIVQAAERLLAAITDDEKSGLISRPTIRKADELRMLIFRWRKAFKR